MRIAEKIKKYSVKIEYIMQGSGIIVRAKNRYYLMTAKHNFKENKDDRINVNIKNIAIDKINIESEYFKNIKIKIEKIIYDYEDLIIFLISGEIFDLDEIEILEQRNYNDKFKYHAIGYPAEKQDSHSFRIEISEYKGNFFTLKNIDHNHFKLMKGTSGTGVFSEYNNILYLSGIILEYINGYSEIKNFNLSKFVKKINKELIKQKLPSLKIKESNLYIKDIPNMYKWILKTHTDNFLVKKTKSLLEEESYTNLPNINTSKKLKQLFNYMMTTNEFFKLEDEYRQKIADMYLLGAFIASKYQAKEEALIYLKKALKFRPEYIIFLAEIDKENSKEELIKAGKIAFVEKNYLHAKNCFQKVLSLKLDKNEEIEVYELIIKIFFHLKEEREELIFSQKLLNLYQNNYPLEKSNLYYRLSIIDRDKLEQLKYVNSGLSEIQEYTTNPTFFEIQYKLKRRKNELLGIKEDILQTEDSYLDLRENLEKLSSTNKNYNGEYQQIVLKENYKDIIYQQKSLQKKYKDTIKKTSIKIWIGILFTVITLPFLIFILINTLDITNKQYYIDKNITKCNQKDINSFKVEECYFKEDNKSKAIIYDINSSSKAIVLQGFPSGKSNFSQNKKIFLKDIFHYRLDNLKQIKNIKVYGHTDLQHIKKQYDNNISSNRDLGSARALKVKEVISEDISRKIIETKYNPDFFMRDTDKILKGKLLKVLSLNNEVNKLIHELNISNESNISIEHIENIRNKFKDVDLSKYKIRFAPFRSVIILINLKEESLIDKYIRKFLQFFKNIPPREKLISNIDVIPINNSTKY